MEQLAAAFGDLKHDGQTVSCLKKGHYQTAALVKIDGVQVGSTHYPAWLFFAVAIPVGLAVSGQPNVEVPSLAIFALGAMQYFSSRKAEVTVFAGEMRLRTTIKGKARAEAVEFAKSIQRSQLKFPSET